MGRQKTKLSQKERLFCKFYLETGNTRESAARAGYGIFPGLAGMRLVSEERIAKEIENERRNSDWMATAASGFRRLAFGGICDAVKLVLGGEFSDEELEKLDLFNISEIKKPKDGCMEIKFFDRVKALENLARLSEAEGDPDAAIPFYRALEESASKIE